MTKIRWRGVVLDTRTRDMLVEVDRLVGPDIPIRPTQGSYSTTVGASAGTHAGGGAVDLSVRDMTPWQKDFVVFALRRVGFAAWRRTPDEGNWPEHIHAIAIAQPDLSPAARRQTTAYTRGRNGLRSNRTDRHRALEAPRTVWEDYT